MSIELTNEEKLAIIDQHIRNWHVSKFENEITLIELNAVSSVNQDQVNSVNNAISDINAKIAQLETQKSLLTTN